MSASAAGTPAKPVGNFEIVQEIGQGGMGVVFLARQPTLDRMVVLKKIRRELLVDPAMLERFQREARAAAAVHHQNVVSIYDSFEARGDHYIAQEFVDGGDLKRVTTQLGKLDAEVAALIALEMARGLEEIHARGIVHRDLKPANILISATGETKIADFGIAVVPKADGLTRPGMLVGSIPYMAPEQVLGHRADHRTDIFLFGNLLYEMLAGSPPFLGPEEEALEDLVTRMQAERYADVRKLSPATPRFLARMIRHCLRAKPARRVSSVTLLRRSLERTLGRPSPLECRNEIAHHLWARGVFRPADGQTAVRSTDPAPARIATRRHLLWAVSAVASLLVVAAGLAGYAQFHRSGDDGGRTTQPVARASEIPRPERSAPALPPALPPEPAHVRFVADPWAEITIDGGASFFTPRAAPLDLQPGTHRVTLAHPTFGRVELTLDVKPGESRTVRHVFPREKAS